MLCDMNHFSSIIGLSETKIKVRVDPYINTELPGYCFLTNYGKFNIRLSGAKLWNSIKEDLKSASSYRFKKLLKESVISKY